MIINKAYKFKLNPTCEQKQKLLQHGGNTRWLWNHFIQVNEVEYALTGKFVFGTDLINSIVDLKQDQNSEFLDLSIAQSLQQVGRHFDKALKDFIAKKKGFPKRKRKNTKTDSFKIPQKFKIAKNYVSIPKIGEIKWKKHIPIKGKVKNITITQEGENWFCSVCCELKIKEKKRSTDNVIGIDVGITTYATMSDGETIENDKVYKKYEKKIKRNQRKLSRRKEGSKNREKQRIKLAKVHKKVKNIRKDFLHKSTHNIIAKCDGFSVENLNIQGMMKNHHLSKAVANCCWYEFKRQLKYKCLWNNKHFVEVDRFAPTSKSCSCCGWIKKDLTLKDRTFECDSCGLSICRDLNAAINIRDLGKRLLWDAQEASALKKRTIEEMGGCSASAQCPSLNQ